MSICCDNCDGPATHLCGECLEAAYCSQECQREDREFHLSEAECLHPRAMNHDEIMKHLRDHYDDAMCNQFSYDPQAAQKELIALRESILISGKNRNDAAHQRRKAKRLKAKNRKLKKKLRKDKKKKDKKGLGKTGKDKKGLSKTAKGGIVGGAAGLALGGVPGAALGAAGGAAVSKSSGK